MIERTCTDLMLFAHRRMDGIGMIHAIQDIEKQPISSEEKGFLDCFYTWQLEQYYAKAKAEGK